MKYFINERRYVSKEDYDKILEKHTICRNCGDIFPKGCLEDKHGYCSLCCPIHEMIELKKGG